MSANLLVGIIGVAATGMAITNLVLLRRRVLRAGASLPRRSARTAAVALAVALVIGLYLTGVALLDR